MVLVAGTTLTLAPASAQEGAAVQELSGTIDAGEAVLYLLSDLRQGQRLAVYAQPTSGNLDPIVGILGTDVDPEAFEAAYEAALDRVLAEGVDPLEGVEAVRDEYSLAWDDDSGGGLTAALEFEVPVDGDYRLLVGGALSALGRQTFGDYRLLLGLDEPQVLAGDAEPTGDVIAVLDVEATPPGVGIQEVSGSLTPDKRTTFFILNRIKEGDTLYVYLEATSGDLIPILELGNFARKLIRAANLDGREKIASLSYTFPIEARNYRLRVSSWGGDGQRTSGDYRLLVGVNAPQVLSGSAEPEGRAVIQEPMEVQIGTRLDQIVDVDQQMEFFTAVTSLQFEWTDPALAFNPETCECNFKTFTGSGVDRFLSERVWPAYALHNRQGNRFIHNRELVVYSQGRAVYSERSTTSFQVDFDFRRFPFDVQEFVIRIDLLYPEEIYRYVPLEGFGEISEEHGEDEFTLTDFEAQVSSEPDPGGYTTSRFTFSFEAPRHLRYYVWSVFVPILLISLVSWVTFFLRDFDRRIEVATGNLLLFIAFRWSLEENYPRLGYLTFMDALMVVLFIVNALVVVYNVWLKRMDMNGQGEQAERIDSVLDWAYPLSYVVLLAGIVVWLF
jgi:hypothetical protein